MKTLDKELSKKLDLIYVYVGNSSSVIEGLAKDCQNPG